MSLIFGSANGKNEENDFELSLESMALISEAILLENLSADEMDELLSSRADLQMAEQEEVLLERSVVRLDKQARLSQAQKIATFSIAKEKNDPMFKKLLTVWRMERFLEAQLFKKYGAQAGRAARLMVSKQSNSRSTQIKKAASVANRQLNGTSNKNLRNPGAMPTIGGFR